MGHSFVVVRDSGSIGGMGQTMAMSDGIHVGRRTRTLAGYVAASVLLHVMVLLLWPVPRDGGKVSAPVRVMTATIANLASSHSPVLPEQATKSESKKPEISNSRREVEARQSVLTAPAEVNSPVTIQAPATTAIVQPAPAPPPIVAVTPAQPVRPVESPPATSPPNGVASAQSDSVDAGSLDQYRLALISAARRYKRYPAQAMERGWQGKVEVRLVIAADGRIKSASVRTSSGYGILDQQALDMITKGKTLAQIPGALRGRDFVVDVPVIFDLQAS